MKSYQILLTDETGAFYEKIAQNAGHSVEQILSEALFKLAGELALEAIEKKKRKEHR